MRIPGLLLAVGLAAAVSPLRAQLPTPSPDPPPSPSGPVSGAEALVPARVVEPPGGPRILFLPVEGSPRVALRLSVPVQEGPSEAGAGRLLQLLALERARDAAALLGARVQASRTPWGIAYTVSGAAADFDHLAHVLRVAAAEPNPSDVTLARVRDRALAEALRLYETATGRIAATLRAATAPGGQLVEGTPATVRALDPATLRNVWARTHRRGRMSLVVVGDVPTAVVLAGVSGLGQAAGPRSEAPSASPPPDEPPPAEVIRFWYAEARDAGDLRDPHGLVVAALVGQRLQELTEGRTETRIEVWEVGGRRVLAVAAAAYPGEGEGLRALVEGILADAAEAASPAAVEEAVARVGAALLLGARTPAGLAGFVGRYHDATGDARGAAGLLQALRRVDTASLRAYLTELQGRTPIRVELRP